MATPNLATVGLSVTPKVLASTQVAAGEVAVYTVGASQAALVDALVLCNTSGAPVAVSVSVVASGGTAGGTNRVVSGYTLQAAESITVDEAKGWLGAGDFISVNAATATSVDVTLRGLVFA